MTSTSTGSVERQRRRAVQRDMGAHRVADDDDRMLHMAHTARFAYGEAPECGPENLARGEWLAPASTPSSGAGSPRCGPAVPGRVRSGHIGDWDLAYAYEALARATSVAGDDVPAAEWKAKARAAGDEIAEADDREQFERDFAAL